jgi:AMP phosphorylase
MRQIIEAQGGDSNIQPEDLMLGEHWLDIAAERDGKILYINNRAIAQIAREAGAPSDKGSGLVLNYKMGDEVALGDPLLRIYAETLPRLENAVKLAKAFEPLGIGNRLGERMLIKKIKGFVPHGPEFVLER